MDVPASALVLVFAAVVVVLVLLEARRQRRRYGAPSGRPNLAGVGLLELQRHLQADRRVETLVEKQRDESAETERDETASPLRPPGRSR